MLNLMATTGLKKVETAPCVSLASVPFSVNNSCSTVLGLLCHILYFMMHQMFFN